MFRDKTMDEVLSYKSLLLGIVRLIHADPNLMLNVRAWLSCLKASSQHVS